MNELACFLRWNGRRWSHDPNPQPRRHRRGVGRVGGRDGDDCDGVVMLYIDLPATPGICAVRECEAEGDALVVKHDVAVAAVCLRHARVITDGDDVGFWNYVNLRLVK